MLSKIIRWGTSATDPALAWRDAVVRNGGSVSSGRLAVVKTFIAAERTSGAWDVTDDYVFLWGENTAQALMSLKQRRLAVAYNSPTFTADRGYAFDGATQYIATGFIPSTHSVFMSGNNLRLAVYERTNVAANSSAAGAQNTTVRNLVIRPRTTGSSMTGYANTTVGTFTLTLADSRGFTVVARNGLNLTDLLGFKNGAALVRSADPTSMASGMLTNELAIGAQINTGSANAFRASSVGMVCWGAGLSAGQELAQYNAVQAWATSVGANV